MRILAAISVAFSLLVTPAVAGNASMSRADGTKISIKCTGSGCNVRGKKPEGNWGKVEQTRGGTKNYNKLVAKYKKMGFE